MIPRIVVLRTPQQKAAGLIAMRPIPADTVFVFTAVPQGTLVHSRGVLEPFDLVFVDDQRNVLLSKRMIPEDDVLTAPFGTAEAWESKMGVLIP